MSPPERLSAEAMRGACGRASPAGARSTAPRRRRPASSAAKRRAPGRVRVVDRMLTGVGFPQVVADRWAHPRRTIGRPQSARTTRPASATPGSTGRGVRRTGRSRGPVVRGPDAGPARRAPGWCRGSAAPPGDPGPVRTTRCRSRPRRPRRPPPRSAARGRRRAARPSAGRCRAAAVRSGWPMLRPRGPQATRSPRPAQCAALGQARRARVAASIDRESHRRPGCRSPHRATAEAGDAASIALLPIAELLERSAIDVQALSDTFWVH